MKAETEAQREKHRKERDWAAFLAKIEREADTVVFQAIWGPFVRANKEIKKVKE